MTAGCLESDNVARQSAREKRTPLFIVQKKCDNLKLDRRWSTKDRCTKVGLFLVITDVMMAREMTTFKIPTKQEVKQTKLLLRRKARKVSSSFVCSIVTDNRAVVSSERLRTLKASFFIVWCWTENCLTRWWDVFSISLQWTSLVLAKLKSLICIMHYVSRIFFLAK